MDERVAAAAANWGPRFITNGVDASDYRRLTTSIERWEDWCAAWCEAGAVHEELGNAAQAEARLRSAGAHLAQAAVYYHFAKFMFVNDLAQMRDAHAKAVSCLTAALPNLDPPGRRIEIPFDGARMVGILRVPAGSGPHPLVIMIPGLDSAKEEFPSTEALFLERGLATFSLDGPGQGEAEYDLRIRCDWEVPGGVALDALSDLPEIDAERIGLWGVSLGGYYAARIASGDPRVKACIALAGPYDWGDCWDRLSGLAQAAFRVRSGSSDDAEARTRASELSLAGWAEQIRCPLLVVFGKLDQMIPWEQAERLAAEAGGPTEFLLFEDGNHCCMNIPYKHRPWSADWMAARLSANTAR